MITFLLVTACAFAQQASPPSPRFAVRVNLLGAINHYAIGEAEYLFNDRLGIFVGGGVSSPVTSLGNLYWFPRSGFSARSGGVYAGVRIGLPLGKVTGFSLKPSVSYATYPRNVNVESDGQVMVGGLNHDPVIVTPRQAFGAYLGLSYTQRLGSRLFIEPVLGIGTQLAQLSQLGGKDGEFHYWLDLNAPVQLNFGIRF